MKKLVLSVAALAIAVCAQQNTARAIYANFGGNTIEYTNPRSSFNTPGTVTAVEGLVITEDGVLENGHAVMDGNAYVKLTNDMADGDWARVWGYVDGTVVDIASNNGITCAVTNTKRVLYKDDVATSFNQLDGPVDGNGTPLDLVRIDVDGEGMPWVIARDGSTHRFHMSGWHWEEVNFMDYNHKKKITPRDIACSDNGIVFITGDVDVEKRETYCVFAFDQARLDSAVAKHIGFKYVVPGTPLPEKQWHMLDRIDIDANGVLWSQVKRVWQTATGWNDRTCLFSTQAIDADGNVDLSIDNDDLYLNDWWIEDIGAQ